MYIFLYTCTHDNTHVCASMYIHKTSMSNTRTRIHICRCVFFHMGTHTCVCVCVYLQPIHFCLPPSPRLTERKGREDSCLRSDWILVSFLEGFREKPSQSPCARVPDSWGISPLKAHRADNGFPRDALIPGSCEYAIPMAKGNL